MPRLNSKPVRQSSPRRLTPQLQRGVTVAVMPNLVTTLARRLDREADVELQHGHVARAEMLATRAAALRGWTV